MVSLAVVSLFTSVPPNYTINVILDKVYKEKKIENYLGNTTFSLEALHKEDAL